MAQEVKRQRKAGRATVEADITREALTEYFASNSNGKAQTV